jgi:hypothetical protein
MTPQDDMDRLEQALKSWQFAVKFHERFKTPHLEKAKAALARVEAEIDDLKRARRDEVAHEELMYIPLFTQE